MGGNNMLMVRKKDGTLEVFNFEKVVNAVDKSAARAGVEFTDEMTKTLQEKMANSLSQNKEISVGSLHATVEYYMREIDRTIASSYLGYRNWKKEMANMMNTVVTNVNKSMESRDRSNSNMNDTLFSAKRTNVSKILLKEMFVNYFLTEAERQAVRDGYIYVHDMDNRLIGTHNCCVVKLENIMNGGFWINGFFCKEPKNITNAVGVVGDIIVSAASAQYGGYSVCEIDTALAKYCEKSFDKWVVELLSMNVHPNMINHAARMKTLDELKDALQGLEFQLNTRESSRGDYPFVTMSFGKDTSFWAREVASTILEVRREGHGDKVKQKVVFPKLVMIVRDDNANDDLLDEAIATSTVALYPDYISEHVASPIN